MKRVLLRAGRWLAVSTVGFALVAAGIVLLFIPGPGLVVVGAGVIVLAHEYRWARRLRDRLYERLRGWKQRAQLRRFQRTVGDAVDFPERDDPEDRSAA